MSEDTTDSDSNSIDSLEKIHPDDVPEDAAVLQCGPIIYEGETIGRIDSDAIEVEVQ